MLLQNQGDVLQPTWGSMNEQVIIQNLSTTFKPQAG